MSDDAFEPQVDPDSIGGRLRRAREERGLSLDDVANQTRIPIRHLNHIELGEWDSLPGITYCVGFVRSYANIIGLDGAELSRELRDSLGDVRRSAPAPQYYEPADPSRVPPRPLVWIAIVAAVVLIAAYVIWRSTLGDGTEPVAEVPVEQQATAPARPGPAAAQAPQAVAGQPVTLTATEEVWLRITDGAGGASLFEGILQAGQTFAVPPTAQRPVIRTGRPQVLRAAIGSRDIGPLEPAERTINDVSLRAEDLAARSQAAGPTPSPASATPPAP
jgi:cytoskeletal protein RodZ